MNEERRDLNLDLIFKLTHPFVTTKRVRKPETDIATCFTCVLVEKVREKKREMGRGRKGRKEGRGKGERERGGRQRGKETYM